MDTIDYSWDKDTSRDQKDISEDIEVVSKEDLSTRHNLQLARRAFHAFNGIAIATLYFISFDHSQMIHLLGFIASALYVVEQVRVNYPETAAKLLPMTKFILRAEEQLKESAMVPYVFATLLTIITFPKAIALVGIYTLAVADPLSAIVGIRFGKYKIAENRTLEGTAAFFVSTFVASAMVLSIYLGGFSFTVFFVSLLLGLILAASELIPLKLDDNLTIPLFTSIVLWAICAVLGLPI